MVRNGVRHTIRVTIIRIRGSHSDEFLETFVGTNSVQQFLRDGDVVSRVLEALAVGTGREQERISHGNGSQWDKDWLRSTAAVGWCGLVVQGL